MTYTEFIQRYEWDVKNPSHLLGEGGFGTVYKAYDRTESRYVAVKVCEVGRQSESHTLKHETELVREKMPSLHRNIAKYELCYRLQMGFLSYDFAILRYYPDGNLKQLVSQNQLSVEQKSDLARQLLDGIVFYQAAGIIHRDLKPANILIAREPNGTYVPKIGDFGISKAFVADAHTQMPNTVKGGTLHFAAPEQLLGDKLGFNADLWSYGILLYWLFVGEHPVEMSQSNTLSYEKQFLNYSEILKTWTLPEKVKHIPQPFQDWVEKCLVVDASKRVKSPHELSVPVIYVDPPTPPVPPNLPIPAPQPQHDTVVETVPPIVVPKPSPQPEPVGEPVPPIAKSELSPQPEPVGETLPPIAKSEPSESSSQPETVGETVPPIAKSELSESSPQPETVGETVPPIAKSELSESSSQPEPVDEPVPPSSKPFKFNPILMGFVVVVVLVVVGWQLRNRAGKSPQIEPLPYRQIDTLPTSPKMDSIKTMYGNNYTVYNWSDGMLRFYNRQTQKQSFVDKDGNQMSKSFDGADDFVNGSAKVFERRSKKLGNYFHIDKTGACIRDCD
jgi:serine/threonine protein kinase